MQRCNDPAYRLANEDVCNEAEEYFVNVGIFTVILGTIVLIPGILLVAVRKEIQKRKPIF